MSWGDSSDQDRGSLCLHTMYNYGMLCAMTGKGVIYIERAEYCLGGIGIAFLEKAGDTDTKQNVFRNECMHLYMCM